MRGSPLFCGCVSAQPLLRYPAVDAEVNAPPAYRTSRAHVNGGLWVVQPDVKIGKRGRSALRRYLLSSLSLPTPSPGLSGEYLWQLMAEGWPEVLPDGRYDESRPRVMWRVADQVCWRLLRCLYHRCYTQDLPAGSVPLRILRLSLGGGTFRAYHTLSITKVDSQRFVARICCAIATVIWNLPPPPPTHPHRLQTLAMGTSRVCACFRASTTCPTLPSTSLFAIITRGRSYQRASFLRDTMPAPAAVSADEDHPELCGAR